MPASIPTTGSRPTRILYVDDDLALARLLQKNLQRRGLIVDVAGGGEEGLAALDADVHDAILVDYDMPGCGGLQVLRTLRARPSHPPVVMVTGNGSEAVAVEAMQLGAADYVVKDVALGYLELLPVVIDRVLQKQQMIRERERMIESVRESEERYRSLVELSPNAITIHVDGEFVFGNQASADLLRVAAPAALVGRRVLDFVRPDYHQLIAERLAAPDGSVRRPAWIEENLSRVDGSAVTVEVTGTSFVYLGKPALQIILRDITERKLAEKRLEYLAHHDGLTGLPNRTLFFDRLAHDVAQARRYGHPMALLFIDLDRFKAVNDTLGHAAGDELLVQVAKRLTESVRESDTVARVGGDEFGVILSQIVEEASPAVVAEKIIAALSRPLRVAGQEVRIGGCVGIAVVPRDGADADALLKKADTAMYKAKGLGTNHFEFFQGEAEAAP